MILCSRLVMLALGLWALSAGCGSSGASEDARDSGNGSVQDAQTDASADGSSRTCSYVPCGGSIAGTWQGELACAGPRSGAPLEECPESTVTTSTVLGGTLTLGADDEATVDLAFDETVTTVVPVVCLAALGDPVDCPALAASLPPGNTCTGDVAQACTCSLQAMTQDPLPGTWTTDGTDLLLAIGSNDPTAIPYCVDGDELFLLTQGGISLSREAP